MPLPQGGILWPPLELAVVAPEMEIWSAWYSGSPEHLEAAYWHERRTLSGHHQGIPMNRPSTYRGGFIGALARTFWGAPRTNLTQPKAKLHVPLAGDICQASADLLFSDPPTLTVDDNTTQDRLLELADDGLFSALAEAAELTAALGGGYLRVTWDQDTLPSRPFLTAVDADGAWPEFRWGRLTAVTFWTDVTPPQDRTGDRRLRHLERHEIDPSSGNGVVLHGLYDGTRTNLGRPIPLSEVPELSGIADEVDDGDTIDTQSPGLAVVYVPNQRPQRLWRHDPIGRNLGRSDLQGVEGLMDALDETYTSWMRDIRLGRARIFAAESALQGLGPGRGAVFDADQEVYTPLNLLAKPGDASGGLPIQAQQFAIRYAEHAATAKDLVTQILRTAGYSTQTFGDGEGVADRTATEVQARQQRSYMTRDRKVRLWRPAIAQFVEKLLAVDKAIFNSGVTPSRPTVDFSDGVQESQISIAQTAQALYAAEAASTKTLVKMVHPDWSDEQVDAEVALIQQEKAAGAAAHVADPFGSAPALPRNQ